MPVYGSIGSTVKITNNAPANSPCTFTITGVTDPKQDSVSWVFYPQNTSALKAPVSIGPGQSMTFVYTVNFGIGSSGNSVTPYVVNCEVTGKVNGQPTTIPGWIELYTDPVGYIERPDNVYLGISVGGSAASVTSQSQPVGQGDPDPFDVTINVQAATVATGAANSIIVSCAEAVVEKVLEGLLDL